MVFSRQPDGDYIETLGLHVSGGDQRGFFSSLFGALRRKCGVKGLSRKIPAHQHDLNPGQD